MRDKESRKMIFELVSALRKKKILDDEDMEKIFGKPEEIRLIDCYKI